MCCTSKIEKILLLGNGGHASVIIDALRRANPNVTIGMVAKQPADPLVSPVPIVGCDEDLPALYANGWKHAFVAVGSVGNTGLRVRLAAHLREIGFALPAVVDPTAVIGSGVQLGEGVYVGAQATVNAQAQIGAFAIINTASVVEHQCCVGAFSHIAPGAVLCGQVTVGAHTHVGARAVVKQGLTIGDHALIGMGSVVVKDIPASVVAHGCPCRVQKTTE